MLTARVFRDDARTADDVQIEFLEAVFDLSTGLVMQSPARSDLASWTAERTLSVTN
jgi:hypothetical protein